MAVGAPPQAPPHAPPPAAFDPKVTAYVFAGSALAILIGVFTKSWAGGRETNVEIGIGPLGAEICFGSVCRSADSLGVDGDITFLGYAALLAGLAAAGVCGWIAASLLRLRRDQLPTFKLANIALLAAAGAMAVFTVRLLTEDQITISWSPVFGLGGVIAASVFLRKLEAAWPDGATVPASWGTAPHHGPPPGAPPAFGAPSSAPPAFGAPASAPSAFGAPSSAPPAFGAPASAPSAFGAPASAPSAFGAPGQPPSSQPAFGAPGQPPPSQPAFGAPGQPPPSQPAFGAPGQPPPSQPAFGAPAQPAQAAAFCPRCGAPMTFVAQYQRWFCERCRQYA